MDTNGDPIYNNTIIAPIVIPIGGQADSVFSALAADTYTVEVADANGCIVTHQVSVPGNHMQLELTPTWGSATCDGTGGGWICGTPDEGRPWPPGYYQYELLQNGVVIEPLQLDSCFTDLAAGSYQIRAWDSCNNFQTRDVILTARTYSNSLNVTVQNRTRICDTTCVVIYASFSSPFGEYPYNWQIIASDEPELLGAGGVWTSWQQYDTLCYSPLFQSGNFTVEVTDACGTTLTKEFDLLENKNYSYGGYSCTYQTLYFTVSSTLSGCDGSEFEVYSAPAGAPIPPPQDSGYFYNVELGTYCVRITDCCGNVSSRCVSVSNPTWSLRQCNSIPGCTPGWTGFRPCLSSPHLATGIKYVITSAPPGYPNSIPDTLGQNGSTWTEGPPGDYCIYAYDICGRDDNACYNYSDTLEFESHIDITPGCVTGNEVTLSISTNISSFFARLYEITPNGPVVVNIGNTTDTTKTLTNWPTGTYYYVYTNTSAGACEMGRDTFSVSDYVPPTISGAWGIECDNGVGLIIAQTSGGLPLYEYELFQGPVTRPAQSSPIFPGLPIGVYDIRVYDQCLNSSITTVSIEPFMPVVQGYGGAFCVGDTAFIYVDYIQVADYTWSGPNGNTSDTSILVIPNLTLADAGTYTIDINIANPDQTSCVAQTLTVELEVFDCVCSAGSFTVNNIDCFNSDNGSVTATMNSNAGGPFTYDWSNGGNTQTINNLPPGTYAVTITDAGGCKVTADTTLFSAPKMDVTASIDNVSCASTSDGEVVLSTNGGVPGYTYQWGSGQMTPTITGLSSGTYSVSVTDANGCCSAFSLMVGMQDCTPCELAENTVIDICTEISNNPNHELATLDCDNGGIDNQTECDNGGDPLDPADDCDVASTANTDICVLIAGNPDHPLANQDCDNGGVNNADECNNGGDPDDPADDCTVAINGSLDICVIIGAEPDHPLATLDCDNGGVDNYTECSNGGDPADPADDCETAIVAEIDICAILNGDPNHPWATLDCDNGGIDNGTECGNGGDPSDPSDDLPCAPCDVAEYNGVDICELIGLDPNHPLATLDCDNGGIDNETECNNGGDPNDPDDECDMAIASNTDICALIFTNPNVGLATMDCDNGGVTNEDECNTGEDPLDPTDDCTAAIDGNLNICQLINYDPNHPLANQDCDNGGIDNWTECQNGGDPSDPIDDCDVVVDEEIDICALLSTDPNNPLGPVDCDGDGVTNATECADGTDPLDPCDFVDTSITLPVTADQSGCENLCPDLTPITTILPGNIAGISPVGVAVEITELNGIDTDGSGILIRVPSDPRLVFVWNPGLTTVALTPVQNSVWNYLGDNGIVHTWIYNGPGSVIPGGTTSAFGFESTYDPQATDGQTTITASIVPFGGGECNILNDTDSERLVYFE